LETIEELAKAEGRSARATAVVPGLILSYNDTVQNDIWR
jgi:hypothetical protein